MAPLQTVPQELKDRLNGITFDTTRNGRKVRDINDVPMCKLQRVIEDFQHAKCEKKRELIQQLKIDETRDIGDDGRYKTGTSKEELKQCLQNVDSGLHKYAREKRDVVKGPMLKVVGAEGYVNRAFEFAHAKGKEIGCHYELEE